MKHHVHETPTVGIPTEHQEVACLPGCGEKTCARLDFNFSDGVRVCAKGRHRNTPIPEIALGAQYKWCGGEPHYLMMIPSRR